MYQYVLAIGLIPKINFKKIGTDKKLQLAGFRNTTFLPVKAISCVKFWD